MMSFNPISPTNLTVLQGVASFSNEAMRLQAADTRRERNRVAEQRRQTNQLFELSIEKTSKAKETSGLA